VRGGFLVLTGARAGRPPADGDVRPTIVRESIFGLDRVVAFAGLGFVIFIG
jgi:hypothetical protein